MAGANLHILLLPFFASMASGSTAGFATLPVSPRWTADTQRPKVVRSFGGSRGEVDFAVRAGHLAASPSDDDSDDQQKDKLSALGFTESEISRSSRPSEQPEEELKVRVDVVDNIDPVTITAIGFGLIAMNFLVFANMGDGGISGLVARLINTFSD